MLRDLSERREPLIITQHGEAKAVIQVASYEETQETLALLEVLALGQQEVEEGKARPLARVYTYVIADGRRDMQSLLERRLLGDST